MRLRRVTFRLLLTSCTLIAFATSISARAAEESRAITNQSGTSATLFLPWEPEHTELAQGPFLPEVEGVRILDGKHASVIDLDALPRVANENYRQVLTRTPGLLVSESGTPFKHLGYRGLSAEGNSFTQVLKDGMPILVDQIGSPESDYLPPLDTVDRIEFIRGGASLLYGPQPGGALNFVTHQPRTDRQFSFNSGVLSGTDEFLSAYKSYEGTVGRVGYLANFYGRYGHGPRDQNSDLVLNSGTARLVLDADRDRRWIMNFDAHEAIHEEPGGLTFGTGPNSVNYDVDRDAASRTRDETIFKRYFLSLNYEQDLGEDTFVSAMAWGGFFARTPKREPGGGFGQMPSGGLLPQDTQKYIGEGAEGRIRHDWRWLGNEHTFAGGATAYYTDAPRSSTDGSTIVYEADRSIFYGAVFAENRFVFGRLSVTPGVRLENIWRDASENINDARTAAGNPLASRDDYEVVPLFGLGLSYEVTQRIEAYAHAAQSYRPVTLDQFVPAGSNAVVNTGLDSARAWEYEVGFRGRPKDWFTFDTSLFLIDFDDRIGLVASGDTYDNIGRSIHQGWEAAVELDVVSWLDEIRDTDHARSWGTVSLHGNVSLLHAEFESGPLDGNETAYAPDYLFRTGLIYRWRDRMKVALLGTFVGDHWANDNNGLFDAGDADSSGFIPHYNVWDLTVEAKVYRNLVSVIAGINNLFDEDYYSRITADGIYPAAERNYYAGVSVRF